MMDMSGQRSPVGAQPNFCSKARMSELRFDVVLPATGGAGPALRELLRAAAAGLLAPAGAFARRRARDHG